MTSGYQPEIIQSVFIDFLGARMLPFWSLTTPKLRLLARYALSDELVALQFEVNRAFEQQILKKEGWQGGQHLNLSVPIDGIYHQRSYSLVGMPYQPLWWDTSKSSKRHTLTIALKPQGLVSNYLTKLAPIGSVFGTSRPSGNFVLQSRILAAKSSLAKPAPLLCIAGGSGITPMLGLVTQALADGRQVTLLHYNRGSILEDCWQDLAANYPAFTYYLIDTHDSNTYLVNTRHLTAQSLLALELPLIETQIYACGSQTLLASLYDAASKVALTNGYDLRDNIVVEHFGSALSAFDTNDIKSNAEIHTVYLRMRQQKFNSDNTILNAAEQAGIRMAYGCRQGICQMCRCNKVSGVVKNVQTGKVSSDGFESIQTCINMAISDVVLDV
ncbi:flavin reductase family protein [uncultured Psychrobacter sp.]|uniref:flavin reductase family protein n=1 Tax=uncultured Psychrobacter sp. TaxID=259303 RepID=UPI0034583D56